MNSESDRLKMDLRTTAGSHDPAARDLDGTTAGSLPLSAPVESRGKRQVRKPSFTVHQFPFYISAWRDSDTRMRLNAAERDIFLELMFYAYKEGSLPTEPRALARIADVSVDEFEKAWPEVSKSFFTKGGRLHNKRVDKELPGMERRYEQKRKAGQKSAEQRRNGRSTDAQRALNVSRTVEQLKIEQEQEVKKEQEQRRPIDDLCREFIEAYPKQGRKKEGLVEHWYAANVGTCIYPAKLHAEIMTGLARAIVSEEWTKVDGKFLCGMLNFLEGKRWREEWPEADCGRETPVWTGDDE